MSDNILEKRNFFLSLSISDGQRLAHEAGFALPSEEVQKSELVDLIRKQLILAGCGIAEKVHECATWVSDLETDVELSEEEVEMSIRSLVSFSLAVLSLLLDSNKLVLPANIEMSEESAVGFLKDLLTTAITDEEE